MRAVVIKAPGEIQVADVPEPKPARGQVVVRVAACGICGTDIHIVDGNLPPTPYPIIPGHEFGGEVVAIGAADEETGVNGVAVGDRVAVQPNMPCGRCRSCRLGRGNICETWRAIGVTHPGGAAELVAVPAEACYQLPDAISDSAAALVEPLSCAVHGMTRLPRGVDDRYLVYGAGTMGLLIAQLARHAGARSISVVDLKPSRLELASRLGASAVATSAAELADNADFDVVVDATGVVSAIEDGLARVRRGGTFLQFGVARPGATARFSPYRIYNEEIDIIGSMSLQNSFLPAVELIADGAVNVEALVSDRLPLTDYQEAIGKFRSGVGQKLQILPGG
jgi:2-desacetyl-2-hydroxyethyl bacteriochlorophyllide A dehydrogenase